MNRSPVIRALNILAYVLLVGVNALANILPLNGLTTGEISDRFSIFFVPAGYVFSIWGVIYLALGAFVIYQALPANPTNARLGRIDTLFVLSCAANIAWLFLWHYEQFPLTLLAMLTLLGILLMIYTRLEIGKRAATRNEYWVLHIPFSIYLGWVSVATIANVAQVLYFIGWDGLGIAPEMWTVTMLVVTAGLAGIMAVSRADAAYILVLIWAVAGIAIKQSATPIVAITAWSVTSFLVFMLMIAFLQRRRWIHSTTG
jgi:hypothetical protein